MLPALFCEKMEALLGAEYPAFLGAMDRPRAVGLRVNPRKTDPDRIEALAAAFGLRPVPWCPTGYSYDPAARPGLHPFHAAGAYYLQEPSAMAPAELLDPQPGERILDLCAAPGGKSTQLAAKLRGRGLLVCNEINPKRAAILSSNIERMGVPNALVLNEHPARLADRFPGWFDRVLVDAPCSGEGMFRKHEAAWADWSPETVAMCARRQGEILDSAVTMLRPGGRLVYSTCTFSPEENEGSVRALLARRPELRVEEVSAPWFAPGRPEWVGGGGELTKTFRLWPHLLGGEGHFAAVLTKTDGEAGADPAPERPARLPDPVRGLLEELGLDLPEGIFVCFGDRVFLAPPELPALGGLKVLRPGLETAAVKGKQAVPAHALALWAAEAPACHDLEADSPACAAYLRGETIPTEAEGWTLVRVEGLSLGWGKGVRGVLKNHYPKAYRINTLQSGGSML